MVRKATVVVAMAVALSAMIFVPAWGGGWAVVTLDSLPGDLRAGEPYEIGFTVRQHGVTPLAGLQPKPTIQATHAETNRQVLAEAVDSGSVGHYVVTLTLPDAGTWNWGIHGLGELQPMPVLHVLARSGAPAAPPRAGVPWALWGSALIAAAGLALGFRRRFACSAVAIAVAVVLGAVGFVRSPSLRAADVEAAPRTVDGSGAALFVAKGCVVCHVHDSVPISQEVSLSVGPALSAYRNDPAFLRRWLANPNDVRPETAMPDLDLAEGEIEALIAFLNAE